MESAEASRITKELTTKEVTNKSVEEGSGE
jgi:hypothetical protein